MVFVFLKSEPNSHSVTFIANHSQVTLAYLERSNEAVWGNWNCLSVSQTSVSGFEATLDLIKIHRGEFAAPVVANDQVALGAIRAFKESGSAYRQMFPWVPGSNEQFGIRFMLVLFFGQRLRVIETLWTRNPPPR